MSEPINVSRAEVLQAPLPRACARRCCVCHRDITNYVAGESRQKAVVFYTPDAAGHRPFGGVCMSCASRIHDAVVAEICIGLGAAAQARAARANHHHDACACGAILVQCRSMGCNAPTRVTQQSCPECACSERDR